MKLSCIENDIGVLNKKIQKLAFTQDEKGKVDLTLGKIYTAYGMRENKLGKFYLILTDTLNTKTPWWMPAALFEIIDANMPTTWVSRQWRGYGKELAHCHPDFFMFEQDIEDGTDQGKLIFARIKKQQD